MVGIWLILIGRGDDARYSGDDDGFDDLLEMGNSFGSYVVMLMGGPYVNEVL